MNDFIRIIKSLENSSLLIDGVSETVMHEIKKPEGWFVGRLLRTLFTSILGKMSTEEGVLRAKRG